jgi:CheY-like chemotaxis protein
LGSLFASASLSSIVDESGSNQSRVGAKPSSSPSQSERTHRYLIVIIEDNPADVFLIQDALTVNDISAKVLVVRDGEEAIRLVSWVDSDDSAPLPELFLLDLNIPTKNGEEVLAHIRNSRRSRDTPVVIITSSDSPKDRAKTSALGADWYFRKPSDYDAFIKVGEDVKEVLNGRRQA